MHLPTTISSILPKTYVPHLTKFSKYSNHFLKIVTSVIPVKQSDTFVAKSVTSSAHLRYNFICGNIWVNNAYYVNPIPGLQ